MVYFGLMAAAVLALLGVSITGQVGESWQVSVLLMASLLGLAISVMAIQPVLFGLCAGHRKAQRLGWQILGGGFIVLIAGVAWRYGGLL